MPCVIVERMAVLDEDFGTDLTLVEGNGVVRSCPVSVPGPTLRDLRSLYERERARADREAGVILQGLELRLGEGVVVADLGAAQRAGDPEVGEELGGALAGHRRAAVRMQGEHLGLDALLETGFLDQRRGERGVLTKASSRCQRQVENNRW